MYQQESALSLTWKSILSLMISILLFAGIVYLADTGLYDLIQNRFYNPSIIKSMTRETARDAELVQNQINYLEDLFEFSLKEPPVRRSFLHDQSAADIYERSEIFGMLLERESGLQSVQFVDANGIRMHFSTSVRDIINQDSVSAAYRNYTEDTRAQPYDKVSVPDQGTAKYTLDDAYDRLIFSFPFYDSMNIYRGTALFNVSVSALSEKLIGGGRLKNGEDVSAIGAPPGIVYGSPETSKTDILNKVAAIWSGGLQSFVTFDAEDSGVRLALITVKTNQNIFYGRLINVSVFTIPDSLKIILGVSIFLTLYLILFFLLNFRPDPATLVQNRLKDLRTNLFEQLYVKKSGRERAKWMLELEQRRDDIREELKRGLKLRRRGRNSKKNIDSLIDKSWDELLSVIKSGSDQEVPVGIDAKAEVKPEVIEEIDELDEIEDAEEIEEPEEIQSIDDDEPDELEDLEEVQSADDEPGELETVEEIDELEELEEVQSADDEPGELEPVEEIDELEELEEVQSADDEPGELETVEEADELEELEEVQPADDEPAELEPVEEADELEELEEVQPADDESAELEPVEEIDELEELEEVQSADDEPGELEELEEAEEPEDGPPKPDAASNIEFSSSSVTHTEENDEIMDTELEIVSPFSSMFSSLEEKEKKDGEQNS